MGRPSIPDGTASLVLLQMSDSDAAELLLKEETGYNVVLRWFVGLKD